MSLAFIIRTPFMFIFQVEKFGYFFMIQNYYVEIRVYEI